MPGAVDLDLLNSGYVDLQINGYFGIDFNDPRATPVQIARAAAELQKIGVRAAIPTVITADLESMCTCLRNIVESKQIDPLAKKIFRGIHIEGPFLSPLPGYIGAHPPEQAQRSDLGVLTRLLDAAQGDARLITLAPEIDVDGGLTREAVDRGCVVAAGHTDASLADLQRCIDSGLSLFTHLGNGCPRQMDRHDNIIYRALSMSGQLSYTLIADGAHIPELLFRNLLNWVDHHRLCVVSDAISAAGLGPGTYGIGHRQVTVGDDRVAWDVHEGHFVGSASSIRDADQWLANCLGLDVALRRLLLCENPARMARLCMPIQDVPAS